MCGGGAVAQAGCLCASGAAGPSQDLVVWWLICTWRPSVFLTHLLFSSFTLHPPHSPSVPLTPPSSYLLTSVGMSSIHPCPGGIPEPQGCPMSSCVIRAAFLLSSMSVPQGCPVSISSVRMAHTHVDFSPCLSLPWGCPHPTAPWDCFISISPTVFPSMSGSPSPDLLAATEHKESSLCTACTVPPVLGLSGSSVAGWTPMCLVRSTCSVHVVLEEHVHAHGSSPPAAEGSFRVLFTPPVFFFHCPRQMTHALPKNRN